MAEMAPLHLTGWAGPQLAEEEFSRLRDRFIQFRILGDRRTSVGPHVWEFAKKINGGRHLPNLKQSSGDCVAFGAAQAGQYMSAFEIYKLGQEEIFKYWFPPFIYGTSRVQVGGGRLDGRAGSLGSWAADAMMQYGVLFTDDAGVPAYSGKLADKWGDRPGPPSEHMTTALDNKVGSAARLRTVDEIREALLNYYMITIASNRGFKMESREYKGYHVFKPQGVWSHQMCLSPDTSIPLVSGQTATLLEMAESGKAYDVYAYDTENKQVVTRSAVARRTRDSSPAGMVRITLDNGQTVTATPDHKFMLRDGTYCEAQHLHTGESLMPLYRRNHKVESVVHLPCETGPVYCLDVEGLHNFAVEAGVFVHNCLIGWMDDPFPAAFRLNSWGSDKHGPPLHDEPPGGAWNLADDLEAELRSGEVEVYALSLMNGFPAAPDFSIL